MKKITFFLCALLISAMSFAETATLSTISTKKVATQSGASVSTTFDGVTCTVTKNSSNQPGFYTSSGIVRYYSKDVMTLSVESGYVITRIEFTMNSGSLGTANPAGLASNTWTGNAESVSFTGGGTVKINKIVVTYETYSASDVIVKTLESIAVEGMTTEYEQGERFKFDGTCTATYSVIKNDVAQEDETKPVIPVVSTPNMEQIGTQTITVSYTDGDKTATTTYDIKVTENVITAGTYDIVPNNDFFWTNFGGSIEGADLNKVYTGKQDDITIQYSKGKGAYLYINNSQTRTYEGTALTISVPTGYVITAIAFTANGNNWEGNHTADVGNMTDSKNWAGSANSVTISFGGKCQIIKITITYKELADDAVTSPIISGNVEFVESTEVTISAEDGLKVYYTLDGTDPTNASAEYTAPFELTATTTVKAVAYEGEKASDIISKTFKQLQVLTCEEAAKLCAATESADKYVIRGYVTDIANAWSDQYSNISFWMADTKDGGKVFEAFRVQPIIAAEKSVKVGDYVEVIGKIVLYGTTPETTQGGTYTIIPAPVVNHTITVSANPAEAGTVTGAGEYEEGATATLTATAAEGYEFTCWTSGKDTVSTANPYKFTVTADVTLVANFKAVEPTTITYELNGGEFPAVVVPTNEELAMAFKQEYAEYFAIEGLTDTDMNREVGNFIYVTNSKGGDAVKFITENANWKWLADYIISVAAAIPEGTNVGYYWRANIDAFFHCKNAVAVGGVNSADFSEAGKPENWGAAYEAAHEVVLPTEPVAEDYVLPTPVKEGYTFVGWYDNAEGTGKAYTVIPAGWSGTLYAIWKQSPTTALDNIAIEGKVVKTIINGQLIIINNGVQYNALGQVIR